jgi:TM2 domain-containing membrane protein YozV
MNLLIQEALIMKSKRIAYILWFIGGLGLFGWHRLYLGKTWTGLLWFFTCGFGGIGALYDFFALESQVYAYNMNVEYGKMHTEYETAQECY